MKELMLYIQYYDNQVSTHIAQPAFAVMGGGAAAVCYANVCKYSYHAAPHY